MKTYVVVEVTHDYYRFQENIGVAHSIEYAWTIAFNHRKKLNRDDILIVTRTVDSLKLSESEKDHINIEEWE